MVMVSLIVCVLVTLYIIEFRLYLHVLLGNRIVIQCGHVMTKLLFYIYDYFNNRHTVNLRPKNILTNRRFEPIEIRGCGDGI
jgi:hypothetical protein